MRKDSLIIIQNLGEQYFLVKNMLVKEIACRKSFLVKINFFDQKKFGLSILTHCRSEYKAFYTSLQKSLKCLS